MMFNPRPLRIAIPKGRLLEPLGDLLLKAGLVAPDIVREWFDSRRLVLRDAKTGWEYLLVKPADVPTYVEYGGADLGMVGKDILVEENRDVCELCDLGIGFCRMVVAVPQTKKVTTVTELGFNTRVGTKFPRVAAAYFQRLGLPVEVVELQGSIELAPLVGLAEAIVDLTATGRTLKENGLREIAEIFPATTRLIANRVSYKTAFTTIVSIVKALERVTGKKEGEDGRGVEGL